MSQPTQITFQFGDGGVHDASVSEISTEQPICFNYGWSIVPDAIGIGGGAAPKYTIKVAQKTGPFQPYDDAVVDADVDQPFEDDHISWTRIRIDYDAKTNLNGTVKFILELKQM